MAVFVLFTRPLVSVVDGAGGEREKLSPSSLLVSHNNTVSHISVYGALVVASKITAVIKVRCFPADYETKVKRFVYNIRIQSEKDYSVPYSFPVKCQAFLSLALTLTLYSLICLISG